MFSSFQESFGSVWGSQQNGQQTFNSSPSSFISSNASTSPFSAQSSTSSFSSTGQFSSPASSFSAPPSAFRSPSFGAPKFGVPAFSSSQGCQQAQPARAVPSIFGTPNTPSTSTPQPFQPPNIINVPYLVSQSDAMDVDPDYDGYGFMGSLAQALFFWRKCWPAMNSVSMQSPDVIPNYAFSTAPPEDQLYVGLEEQHRTNIELMRHGDDLRYRETQCRGQLEQEQLWREWQLHQQIEQQHLLTPISPQVCEQIYNYHIKKENTQQEWHDQASQRALEQQNFAQERQRELQSGPDHKWAAKAEEIKRTIERSGNESEAKRQAARDAAYRQKVANPGGLDASIWASQPATSPTLAIPNAPSISPPSQAPATNQTSTAPPAQPVPSTQSSTPTPPSAPAPPNNHFAQWNYTRNLRRDVRARGSERLTDVEAMLTSGKFHTAGSAVFYPCGRSSARRYRGTDSNDSARSSSPVNEKSSERTSVRESYRKMRI